MFSVQPVTDALIPSIHHAIDTVSREDGLLGITEAPPETEFARQMQAAMDRGSAQFVATAGGEVVGWCLIFRNEFPLFKHVGYLFMGTVSPWRKRGIGTALLQAALCAAWKNRFHRIELEVLSTNEAAIALYRRMGFMTEGVKRQAYEVDGKYSDILLMALLNGHGRDYSEVWQNEAVVAQVEVIPEIRTVG